MPVFVCARVCVYMGGGGGLANLFNFKEVRTVYFRNEIDSHSQVPKAASTTDTMEVRLSRLHAVKGQEASRLGG